MKRHSSLAVAFSTEGDINFLPVIEVVRGLFGVEEGMTEDQVRSLILEKAANSLGSLIPFFLNLLSLRVDDPLFQCLDPEARKFGTFEAIKSLLLALAAERPLILFLEDVHWTDKLSEDLFTYFSRGIPGHPVLDACCLPSGGFSCLGQRSSL